MTAPGLERLARTILAGVFLWACAHKILDPETFAVTVFRYHLLPGVLVNPVAWSLPWVELVLALALLGAPGWRGAAALVAALLLVAFTAGMGINLVRGNPVSCGCFQAGEQADALTVWNLLRNLVFALLAVLVARRNPG